LLKLIHQSIIMRFTPFRRCI